MSVAPSPAHAPRSLRRRLSIRRRRFRAATVRERFLRVSCFLLALASLLAQTSKAPPSTPAPADRWPQFRGNATLTGVSAAPVPQNLKLLWTYEAGESVESSAAIAGGTVYVGAASGQLAALDLKTGAVRWKYQAGKEGIGESSPTVANDTVFVGDLGGVFHAVNALDGRVRWTFKAQSEIKSSPVVNGDKVLFGSYDEHLYALHVKDGSLAWKFKIDGPVHCTPAISNGMTFISGCDSMFRAVRIADGQQVFELSSDAYTGASPAIDGDMAYFGTFSNEVLGVNLRTRKVVWRYEHPQRHFPFYSSAAVADGKVVLGGRDRFVHCLDGKSGKALWTFATRSRVESSPAIAGGRVYIGSNDGRFYVLDLASGKKLWEFEAGAPLSASPALAEGRIVIGSQDGKVYCFGQG